MHVSSARKYPAASNVCISLHLNLEFYRSQSAVVQCTLHAFGLENRFEGQLLNQTIFVGIFRGFVKEVLMKFYACTHTLKLFYLAILHPVS